MADVKDILGVSRAGGVKQELKKDEKEKKMQRPAGMSREAFALLDRTHPVVPSLTGDLRKKGDLQGLKEKRKTAQVSWQWLEFENQGRSDGLKLSHWTKCSKDLNGKVKPVEQGDYGYAKYNKKLLIHRYNEEEWTNVIAKDPAWSKEETDYLLDLCDQFCLRFMVIADRYEFPDGTEKRSMEDLKARYYSIARQLMIAREGNQEDIENQILIKSPFNAEHERERKKAVLLLMQRTPQQEAEENAILEQAKAIEAVRRAEDAANRPAQAGRSSPPAAGPSDVAVVAPPEFLDIAPPGQPSLLTAEGLPCRPEKPGVYLRRLHTEEQAKLQFGLITGGARGTNAFEKTLADLHVTEQPKTGSRSVCCTWLALRAEVIQMLELKQQVAKQAGRNTPGSSADGRKRPPKNKAARGDDDSDVPKEKRPRLNRKNSED